jgi:hypothetical protein
MSTNPNAWENVVPTRVGEDVQQAINLLYSALGRSIAGGALPGAAAVITLALRALGEDVEVPDHLEVDVTAKANRLAIQHLTRK